MPLYDYKCPKCENEFSELLSLEDYSPLRVCPLCNMPSPRKISAAQLQKIKASERLARERNEKSIYEPLRVTRKHECTHEGCSHEREQKQKGTFQQIREGTRPWMLG